MVHRSFSLRRHRSQPLKYSKRESFIGTDNNIVKPNLNKDVPAVPSLPRSLSQKLLRRFNSRRKSAPVLGSNSGKPGQKGSRESTKGAILLLSPIDDGEGTMKLPERAKSRRERLSFVLANPDTLFTTRSVRAADLGMRQGNVSDSQLAVESRIENSIQNSNATNSIILRTLFSPKVDFAPTPSVLYKSSLKKSSQTPEIKPVLDPDAPIFSAALIPEAAQNALPNGFMMRPLQKSDYSRGFLEVLRVAGKVGYVSNRRWDERCEYLKRKADEGEEFVVVVVDEKPDRVVGVGRWSCEKGFMNNLATLGRLQDISVARDQKGKKIGLRILEALVHISKEAGCQKTTINCSEANEAFHAQVGFTLEGSMMTLQHTPLIQRKPLALNES